MFRYWPIAGVHTLLLWKTVREAVKLFGPPPAVDLEWKDSTPVVNITRVLLRPGTEDIFFPSNVRGIVLSRRPARRCPAPAPPRTHLPCPAVRSPPPHGRTTAPEAGGAYLLSMYPWSIPPRRCRRLYSRASLAHLGSHRTLGAPAGRFCIN
jgi:hypothetical protein